MKTIKQNLVDFKNLILRMFTKDVDAQTPTTDNITAEEDIQIWNEYYSKAKTKTSR